jgi:two-component system chemotaxis response regulator CheY
LKQLGFATVDEAPGVRCVQHDAQQAIRTCHLRLEHGADDGYELLREVRADDRLSRTPFIMVTAESKTENVIAAKKAGVNNYIVKPFNAATLKAKIDAIFGE